MPLLNVLAGAYHRTIDSLLFRSASYSAGLAVEYMRPCLTNLHTSHPHCAELSSAAKLFCSITVCNRRGPLRLMIALVLVEHLSHLFCSYPVSILEVQFPVLETNILLSP
jgi:hypothetical protein